MPIYEYRCAACRRTTTVVTLSIKEAVEPVCGHCGGRDLAKLVSRVAIKRSETSRLESLAGPASLAGLDESDPASVGRWMKRMGREMGEETGEDFDREVDEAMDEAAHGEETGENGGPEAGEGEEL